SPLLFKFIPLAHDRAHSSRVVALQRATTRAPALLVAPTTAMVLPGSFRPAFNPGYLMGRHPVLDRQQRFLHGSLFRCVGHRFRQCSSSIGWHWTVPVR